MTICNIAHEIYAYIPELVLKEPSYNAKRCLWIEKYTLNTLYGVQAKFPKK